LSSCTIGGFSRRAQPQEWVSEWVSECHFDLYVTPKIGTAPALGGTTISYTRNIPIFCKSLTNDICSRGRNISWKREMPTELFTHNYYGGSIEKTEHGTHMAKYTHNFEWKFLESRPCEVSRNIWEDNIKVDLMDIPKLILKFFHARTCSLQRRQVSFFLFGRNRLWKCKDWNFDMFSGYVRLSILIPNRTRNGRHVTTVKLSLCLIN
jgi:hypothetical protein